MKMKKKPRGGVRFPVAPTVGSANEDEGIYLQAFYHQLEYFRVNPRALFKRKLTPVNDNHKSVNLRLLVAYQLLQRQ